MKAELGATSFHVIFCVRQRSSEGQHCEKNGSARVVIDFCCLFNMSVLFSFQGDCQFHGQLIFGDEMKGRERERERRENDKQKQKKEIN